MVSLCTPVGNLFALSSDGWPLWKSAVTSLVCRVRALILRNWAVSYFVGVFVAVGTGCVPTAAN